MSYGQLSGDRKRGLYFPAQLRLKMRKFRPDFRDLLDLPVSGDVLHDKVRSGAKLQIALTPELAPSDQVQRLTLGAADRSRSARPRNSQRTMRCTDPIILRRPA